MPGVNYVGFIIFIAIVVIDRAFSNCPLLNGNVRLECFGTFQRGCNVEFTDAYPRLAWDYLNLTKADTHFYMFTNANPDDPELMQKCAGGLPENTTFNPDCPTEVIIPGYLSGICNFAIFRELIAEILKSGCYNVIGIDYTWGNQGDLEGSFRNLPIVAEQIAVVIEKLKERFKLTADDFTLTGHSFGAQIAGFVGQITAIGRINGLDPAGVLFSEKTPLNGRLDAGDAKCVQVIHTNAGECLPEFFGVNFTCGTMDFWVNGGLIQTSCVRQIPVAFLETDFLFGLMNLYPAACNHFQSVQYYRASINPTNCQFVGVQCDSYEKFQRGECRDCGEDGENCAVMGAYSCDCPGNCGPESTNYYLNTKKECPYCDNSDININGYECCATII